MLCKYDTRPPGCHTSIHSHTHKLLYIYTNFQPCISVKTCEQRNYFPRKPPKLIISQAFIEKMLTLNLSTKRDKSLNNQRYQQKVTNLSTIELSQTNINEDWQISQQKSSRSRTIIIATAEKCDHLAPIEFPIWWADLKCRKSCWTHN